MFIEIDECESSPCENGATCQDEIDSFTCQCAEGYTGVTCSEGKHKESGSKLRTYLKIDTKVKVHIL